MRDGRSSRGLRDPLHHLPSVQHKHPAEVSDFFVRDARVGRGNRQRASDAGESGRIVGLMQLCGIDAGYYVDFLLMMLTRNISGGSLGSRGSFALHVDDHGRITMIWKHLSVRRALQVGGGTSLVCMSW